MKVCTIVLVLFGLILAFNVEAQFQKGSILLEGNAGYSTNFKNDGDGDDYKAPYQFNIGAKAGYFLDAKNEIGIGLSWGKNRSYFNIFNPDLNLFNQNSSTVTSSVYWRHYTPIGERLFFSYAAGTDAGFSNFTTRDFNTGNESEYKAFQLRIGITPSLVYMLNSKIGLRGNFGNLGFSFTKQKDVEFWENSFSANFSPQSLNFGLFLLLNGAKPNN